MDSLACSSVMVYEGETWGNQGTIAHDIFCENGGSFSMAPPQKFQFRPCRALHAPNFDVLEHERWRIYRVRHLSSASNYGGSRLFIHDHSPSQKQSARD